MTIYMTVIVTLTFTGTKFVDSNKNKNGYVMSKFNQLLRIAKFLQIIHTMTMKICI